MERLRANQSELEKMRAAYEARMQLAADAVQASARSTPHPPLRTKWTRRVPRTVLIGHAASLTGKKLYEGAPAPAPAFDFVRSARRRLGRRRRSPPRALPRALRAPGHTPDTTSA